MIKLTLLDGEVIEANLNEIVYVSGLRENYQTVIRGRKVFLSNESAKFVRDDIHRRNEEYERQEALKEIIWAS